MGLFDNLKNKVAEQVGGTFGGSGAPPPVDAGSVPPVSSYDEMTLTMIAGSTEVKYAVFKPWLDSGKKPVPVATVIAALNKLDKLEGPPVITGNGQVIPVIVNKIVGNSTSSISTEKFQKDLGIRVTKADVAASLSYFEKKERFFSDFAPAAPSGGMGRAFASAPAPAQTAYAAPQAPAPAPQAGGGGFCPSCGTPLNGARFCPSCGTPAAGGAAAPRPAAEKVGNIQKCPSCGAVVPPMAAVCPECGHSFTNVRANSTVQDFFNRLDALSQQAFQEQASKTSGAKMLDMAFTHGQLSEGAKRQISMIEGFPIPNAKEDIIELVLLASSRYKGGKKPGMFGQMGNDGPRKMEQFHFDEAWKVKCEQALSKARLSFGQDKAAVEEIERMLKQKKIIG